MDKEDIAWQFFFYQAVTLEHTVMEDIALAGVSGGLWYRHLWPTAVSHHNKTLLLWSHVVTQCYILCHAVSYSVLQCHTTIRHSSSVLIRSVNTVSHIVSRSAAKCQTVSYISRQYPCCYVTHCYTLSHSVTQFYTVLYSVKQCHGTIKTLLICSQTQCTVQSSAYNWRLEKQTLLKRAVCRGTAECISVDLELSQDNIWKCNNMKVSVTGQYESA